MSFRKFLTCLAIAMGLVSNTVAAQRPNILFIFIDDIGWGDLSCYGSSVTNKAGQVITPNLDRLASEGIRFTQGYVASPICSPSRTGVLTGIEPARYAIYSFLNDKGSNASRNMSDWVQPDTVTAPRLFKEAGYRTGQFGKWHMGGGRDVNDAPFPQDYGFEDSLVAFEGMGDRILYKNYNLSLQNADVPGSIEWVEWYEGAGKHTDAALKFMTNVISSGKQFYMHVPYNDTHSPYNVPPGQENDFDHITTDLNAKTFLGELHNLDKQVGRLIAAVDGLGIATNTLIVVVGDNGAPNDAVETILNRNGGLKGGKGNLYEGGIRELFIARWPGRVPAGRVNSTTVISTLDLLPTYCSFADIRLPNAPFAGEDMSDVFSGATRLRSRPLFWEYGTVSGLSPASPKLAIRDGNYKFMRDPEGTRRELYLVPQDHSEAINLVSQSTYRNVVTNLETRLMQWYDQIVLGDVGETYVCEKTNFQGLLISDSFEIGGSSPSSGFELDSGVNYQFAQRSTGALAAVLQGYRLGTTGGTVPRQAVDFSIVSNRLSVAPREGNGRFEFSEDGVTPYDFGSYLAGQTYELSFTMSIEGVGANYSQRVSAGLSDASNAAVGDVDLGVQIGSDGAGGIAVFKRLDAAATSSGSDVNTRIHGGLPIGIPVRFLLRITDDTSNPSAFGSMYEIWVNDALLDMGQFRFNGSTTSRYIVFDVAAHEFPVHYDEVRVNVTGGGPVLSICRKPTLSISSLNQIDGNARDATFFWTAQPGLSIIPEFSMNLIDWLPATNSSGTPIAVTTQHGSIQWLNLTMPQDIGKAFVRLRKQ